MTRQLSANEIKGLGFAWPKYPLVEKYCVLEDGQVDLGRTIEALRSGQAFYRKQIRAAYNFKRQTGADYADFTDRFDDYARLDRDLGTAIAYLEEIREAAS